MLISRSRLATTLICALMATLAIAGAIPLHQLAERQLIIPKSYNGTLTEYDFPGKTRCGQTIKDSDLLNFNFLAVNEAKFGTNVCGHNLTIVFDNGRSASAAIVDYCTGACDLRGTAHLYGLGLGPNGDNGKGYLNVSYYETP